MKIITFSFILCVANAFIQPFHKLSCVKVFDSPKEIQPVSVNIFSRSFDKNINLDEIQVFEPHSVDKKQTECLLLFTGISSIIPCDFYSNVLNYIAGKNVAIYIPKFKYNNIDKLIKKLSEEYKEVIPISHSSGVNILVEKCSKHKSINKIILLDPVDARFIKSDRLHMKFIKKILFIIAKKSYDGNPTFIPSFFSITEDSFHLNKDYTVETIESDDHGHCDILNPVYSNMMHNIKICDGDNDRKASSKNNYHKWIANNINIFIKEIKLEDCPKEENYIIRGDDNIET